MNPNVLEPRIIWQPFCGPVQGLFPILAPSASRAASKAMYENQVSYCGSSGDVEGVKA